MMRCCEFIVVLIGVVVGVWLFMLVVVVCKIWVGFLMFGVEGFVLVDGWVVVLCDGLILGWGGFDFVDFEMIECRFGGVVDKFVLMVVDFVV